MVLTLLFPKWSIMSATAIGSLFILMISFITSVKSLMQNSVFFFYFPVFLRLKLGILDHVFHLPTFDKSYLSKLKNILKINSLAESGVTKSPRLNLLYTSTNASFWFWPGSLFKVSSIYAVSPLSKPTNIFRMSSSVKPPKAFSNVVAGTFLFLSIFTAKNPEASVSNSSHAPLLGIILAANIFFLYSRSKERKLRENESAEKSQLFPLRLE